MGDSRNRHQLFSEANAPTARLIRCTEPPDLSTLTPGDMVICEDAWGIEEYTEDAAERGVHVRSGRYRHEVEKVINRRTRRVVAPDFPAVLNQSHVVAPAEFMDPTSVQASSDAFARTWDALSATIDTSSPYTPVEGLIPNDWVPFLPFPTINPAQAQALPVILSDRNAMIVAPTGAGKTVVGMLAALREIKGRGGKAVWLVPQRSLTSELDRELNAWRQQDMKVVSLSGETVTNQRKTREADLWVATTEKFEALCRASSMREAVAGIGTLIVDEIHLLGEPSRGPMLETLLARIKDDTSTVRLVGLSATAANAHEVAEWLDSELVEITWRPTRLTQQLLTIPIGEKTQQGRHRNALCAAIAQEVTLDGGSTLIFCGTKANVRSAALAVAHSRGVDTAHIDHSDVAAVADACEAAGVGLHYSDWPHKAKAERDFRDRQTNVLVATSTLAAGVNTPARVVVVRDTSIGPTPMEVSMVQQMFGRAGRAGQEPEGWSMMICSSDELAMWRKRLADGYTINSGILDSLSDHALGEVVQGRITSLRELERWWESTFAYHQGARESAPLAEAKEYLERWRFIECEETDNADQRITATPLGRITSQMMVPVRDAASLVSRIGRTPTPPTHTTAEDTIIEIVSEEVWSLANSPDAPQDQCAALMRILTARGNVQNLPPAPPTPPGSRLRVKGQDVVRAGLLLCARSPQAAAQNGPRLGGVNRSLFHPALYDTPRYFAWMSALGPMGLTPGWVGVVAADLGARVKHHRLAPPRGSGRLLRMCEQMVGSDDGAQLASAWREVKASGITSPLEWTFQSPPGGASLKEETAQSILSARVRFGSSNGKVKASSGNTFVAGKSESGMPQWKRVGAAEVPSGVLAASFGSRGDWSGTGWLDHFSRITFM